MKKLGRKTKSWVLAIAFTKQRFPRASDARDRSRLGKRTGKEKWVPICEKLEQVMERRKHCAPTSIFTRARVLAVGISSRIEYAVVCCVPRSRLVRPCDRAHDKTVSFGRGHSTSGQSCVRIPGLRNNLPLPLTLLFSP